MGICGVLGGGFLVLSRKNFFGGGLWWWCWRGFVFSFLTDWSVSGRGVGACGTFSLVRNEYRASGKVFAVFGGIFLTWRDNDGFMYDFTVISRIYCYLYVISIDKHTNMLYNNI